MNILLIGSGGREHALTWKLTQSPRVERVFVAPGNAGTDIDGENIPIAASDFAKLVRFAKENGVGDEAVDHLQIHLKRGDGLFAIDFDAMRIVTGKGFGAGARPDFSVSRRKIRNRQTGVLVAHRRGNEELHEN